MMVEATPCRKFRFDSFASEFGCKDDRPTSHKANKDDIPDDDSGIGESRQRVLLFSRGKAMIFPSPSLNISDISRIHLLPSDFII